MEPEWYAYAVFIGWIALMLIAVAVAPKQKEPSVIESDAEAKIWKRLRRLERSLNLMATKAEFDAGFSELNAGLDTVKANIKALEDKVAAGGMSAEEEADVFAKLTIAKAKVAEIVAPPAPVDPPVEPTV